MYGHINNKLAHSPNVIKIMITLLIDNWSCIICVLTFDILVEAICDKVSTY